MNNSELYIDDKQYLCAINTLRTRVTNSEKPIYSDCTDVGNNSTKCSWGLCGDDEELFPHENCWAHVGSARILKYLNHNHVCPARMVNSRSNFGCFYNCAVFWMRKNGMFVEDVRGVILKNIDTIQNKFAGL